MKLFHFAFIGAFSSQFTINRPYASSVRLQSGSSNVLNLDVGGVKYSLFHNDIRKHSGSMLEKLTQSPDTTNEWIPIDRSGETFKYVQAYLATGHLPRNTMGQTILDQNTLNKVREEADYFGIEGLKQECAQPGIGPSVPFVTAHRRIRQYIDDAWSNPPLHPLQYYTHNTPLLVSLREAWTHVCLIARYWAVPRSICVGNSDYGTKIWRKYTTDEFLAAVLQRITPAEAASSTIEVDVSRIEDLMSEMLHLPDSFPVDQLFPGRNVSVHPRKLVIHKAGSICSAYRSHKAANNVVHNGTQVGPHVGAVVNGVWESCTAVCRHMASSIMTSFRSVVGSGGAEPHGDTHVGTVVGLLDSVFEGGEMTVTCGDSSAQLKLEPNQMAIMHRNCTYSIQPVTSGMRTSFIYDVIAQSEPAGARIAVKEEQKGGNSRVGSYKYDQCNDKTAALVILVPERTQPLVEEMDRALAQYESVVVN